MRLNKKRVLLIEPDDFQALILSDISKNYEPQLLKFEKWDNEIEHSLGCDIDLDIHYQIEVNTYFPKDREQNVEITFNSFSTIKMNAYYGGDEIEFCVCWTDNQWNEFIKELEKYI